MMDSGKIIRCMDGVNYTMKVGSWLMKDIGLMMSFMDMVKSTMMIRISYKPVSITQISTYWEIPGTTTKAT